MRNEMNRRRSQFKMNGRECESKKLKSSSKIDEHFFFSIPGRWYRESHDTWKIIKITKSWTWELEFLIFRVQSLFLNRTTMAEKEKNPCNIDILILYKSKISSELEKVKHLLQYPNRSNDDKYANSSQRDPSKKNSNKLSWLYFLRCRSFVSMCRLVSCVTNWSPWYI